MELVYIFREREPILDSRSTRVFLVLILVLFFTSGLYAFNVLSFFFCFVVDLGLWGEKCNRNDLCLFVLPHCKQLCLSKSQCDAVEDKDKESRMI